MSEGWWAQGVDVFHTPPQLDAVRSTAAQWPWWHRKEKWERSAALSHRQHFWVLTLCWYGNITRFALRRRNSWSSHSRWRPKYERQILNEMRGLKVLLWLEFIACSCEVTEGNFFEISPWLGVQLPKTRASELVRYKVVLSSLSTGGLLPCHRQSCACQKVASVQIGCSKQQALKSHYQFQSGFIVMHSIKGSQRAAVILW